MSALIASGCIADGALADESQIDDYVHEGAATCASSVCHNKLSRQDDQNVWLNEYRIWTGANGHSGAYRTLQSDESQRIADYLGIQRATGAKVCLDCHTDNVPKDKQGARYLISDGVSCEACHGGAEKWIKSHAVAGATHAENLANGMYPTESPTDRAALCLSCHMGSKEKFAGHDVMGAGHPRLSFELETFTSNQPAHYEVDDDYRLRKGEISGFELWFAGQVESARRFLDLTRTKLVEKPALYPELAFYDCHGCHHPMDDKRWTPARVGARIPPGSLRLQDQHLLVLQIAVGVLESAQVRDELAAATEAYVRSGQQNFAAVLQSTTTLIDWLSNRQAIWSSREFDQQTIIAVRQALVRAAAVGKFSDYNAAEQLYLALESLSFTLGDRTRLEAPLDSIFEQVKDDILFNPDAFAGAARSQQGQF